MGWTFYADRPGFTRAEMIAREFTQPATVDNPRAWGFDMIAERGATVYAIMWRDAPGEARRYFGAVFLTQRRRGEFGYKDITEDMGPCQCEMPARMLERLETVAPLAADDSSYARQWREKVRAYHAERRTRARTQWAPGQCVKFSPSGDVFQLIAPAGSRRGWHVIRMSDRAPFRAPAARFSHAVTVNP